MTNGDCIRSMTDEELRDLFGKSSFYFTCPVNIPDEECTKTDDCIECFYKWLKKEADNG